MINLKNVQPPPDAPGPEETIIGEQYQDKLIIYDAGDAGWNSRCEIALDDPCVILDIRHCC